MNFLKVYKKLNSDYQCKNKHTSYRGCTVSVLTGKKPVSKLLILAILTCFYSCTKTESTDVELPSTVEIRNSLLYLNGSLIDYTHQLFHDTINNQMIFAFEKSDVSYNSKKFIRVYIFTL